MRSLHGGHEEVIRGGVRRSLEDNVRMSLEGGCEEVI